MRYSEFEDLPEVRSTMIQPNKCVVGAGKTAEQRQHTRASWYAEVTVKELPCDSMFPTLIVSGEVVNISRGGACIASNVPLVPGCVVQCEMSLPGLGIPLPTLMQVVWVLETDEEKYFWGLRYIV